MKNILSFSRVKPYYLCRSAFSTVLAAFIFFNIQGCSSGGNGNGPDPVTTVSSDNTLYSLTFNSEVNSGSGVTLSAYGVFGTNVVYVTVPEGADKTYLIPTVDINEKAKFYMDGNSAFSGVTATDFSKAVKLTVEAENGKRKDYYILVKNGNATIDKMVYNFMIKYSIPGMSCSVSKNEALTYSYGYGYANKDNHEMVYPNMLFRLASMSKQITTLCIMKLYEEGKIDLDRNVFGEGGYLADEFGDNMPDKAKRVTLRNLLQHTSGWISDPDPMFTGDGRFYGKSLHDRIAYVLDNVPQTYEPGAHYSYYNLGFGMVGRIIETITGEDYETYVKEVVALADCKDIHVGGDREHRRENEVVYYSQSGTDGYGNPMTVIEAAGGIIASSVELMRLMACIDYGTVVPDMFEKSTLDLMYTPCSVYPYYGLGWRVYHSAFKNWAAYHSGNLAGTATIWMRGYNGVSCALLANSRSYIDGFDDAQYTLLYDIEEHFK